MQALKRTWQDVQDWMDDVAVKLGDPDYVEGCKRLKQAYNAIPERTPHPSEDAMRNVLRELRHSFEERERRWRAARAPQRAEEVARLQALEQSLKQAQQQVRELQEQLRDQAQQLHDQAQPAEEETAPEAAAATDDLLPKYADVEIFGGVWTDWNGTIMEGDVWGYYVEVSNDDGVSGSEEWVASNELRPVQALRGDFTVILRGEHKGRIGKLIGVDNEDGIVKWDENGEITIVNYVDCGKLGQSHSLTYLSHGEP